MMEKKSKFNQPSTKGVASEAKKSQDAANGKTFPRASRRREPTSATCNFPRIDQRKSNVQKTKNFDKRPKPKGQYHGGPKEDPKVAEEEVAEYGSVMVTGSKKQNLNHLLNFHYAPRDVLSGSATWSHNKPNATYNRHSNRWLPPVQRHKYNKEQFLQASCQFVVKANGDYSVNLADPDILVDWVLIEEIRLYSPESLSCPICLCPPVAGKMTRCGHVYCWPCMLHYLSLSDKTWRKCPICYESIHKTDLKSVVEQKLNALNIGDKVSLRLMRREKGSLLPVPVGEQDHFAPTTFFTVSENQRMNIYSKLLLANKMDVLEIIERERVHLKYELMEDPNSPETCFIQQALDELETREQQLYKENQTKEEHVNESPVEDDSAVKGGTNIREESAKSLKNISSDDQQGPSVSMKYFYFYQAEDGQQLYLHAMNVKMLEMEYGSLENSPHVIVGKLLEKEAGSLTEDLRRRMRYLCHLPVTSQFEIAEIELTPPFVSNDILDYFHEQLESRHRKRQRRDREERKREKKINEEENKRMGRFPASKLHIESRRHFPQWQPESIGINIPTPPESTATSSVASSPSLNSTFDELASNASEFQVTNQCESEIWGAIGNGNAYGNETGTGNRSGSGGPSFAEMLRNTGNTRMKSNESWPSVGTFGSQMTKSKSAVSFDTADNDEFYVSPPSYSRSFGDALAQALEQTELLSDSGKKTATAQGKSSKKKKAKATVLFATNMARAP